MVDFCVIGVDGASWNVIKPNLKDLPTFASLEPAFESIHLKEYPGVLPHQNVNSATIWTSMFSGKLPLDHNHLDFIKHGDPDQKLLTRNDIKVDFVWDVLDRRGVISTALNIPFVVPPFNYRCAYKGFDYGLSITFDEMKKEIDDVSDIALNIIDKGRSQFFAFVWTAIDRCQHLFWAQDEVMELYKRVDRKLAKILPKLSNYIIISDHGFNDRDKCKYRTLPNETPWGEIKGDHYEESVLIQHGAKFNIQLPQDVFWAISRYYNL